MSDLISRSQLLKEIETWGGCVDALHDYIQNMPTAYDVDKVVEELEKESFTTTDTVCGGIFKAIRLSSAIEIVKQGYVSDDVCEWESVSDGEFIQNPHTKRLYSNEPSMQNVYCNTCGKKIKVVE